MNVATYIVGGVAILGCVGAWLWFAGSEGINRINWRMNATVDPPDTNAAGVSNVTVIDEYAEHARREADKRRRDGDAGGVA